MSVISLPSCDDRHFSGNPAGCGVL